jgi:hypothetical protein
MHRSSLRSLMVIIALAAVGLAVVMNSGRPLFIILAALVLRMIGERVLRRKPLFSPDRNLSDKK